MTYRSVLRRGRQRNGDPTMVERDELMVIALLAAPRSSAPDQAIRRRAHAELLAATDSSSGKAR